MVKKPRKKSAPTDDKEISDEHVVVPKRKVKERKHAAPTIDIHSDDVADKPPVPVKSKVVKKSTGKGQRSQAAQAKPSVEPAVSKKAAKVTSKEVLPKVASSTVPSKAVLSKAVPSKAVPLKTVRLVAESASDPENSSKESDSSGDEDKDDSGGDDVSPNPQEFISELPRVLTRQIKVEVDAQMVDVPKAVEAPKAKCSKTKPTVISSDTEGSDVEMMDPVKPPRLHRRCSSMASGSSGQDVIIPDTDFDDFAGGTEPDSDSKPPSTSSRHIVGGSDSEGSTSEAVDVPKQKPRKISAARQKKADLEKPQIRAVAERLSDRKPQIKANPVAMAVHPESSWHVSTQMVMPGVNKSIALTSQSEELKAVLRGSIQSMKVSLLFDDAFTVMTSRAGYAQEHLLKAAHAQLPDAAHVEDRLLTDLKFAVHLADIPLDHNNILHGNMKKYANLKVPAIYKFGELPPLRVKEHVKYLLEKHQYIFPIKGRLISEEPFLHPMIAATLKFLSKDLARFKSNNPKRPEELELPDSMVALAATVVYAVLMEYNMNGEHKNIPFTEDAYEDTYRNHRTTLSDTRGSAPKSLHQVLHKLFNSVTASKGVQATTVSSSVLINLVDLPESD
ncbi:hypothetical protein B0H10DRAFT_2220060 [Mycena sp. CBHHK59/15]|nr:hypothetical protein B0H10DRAFT_2220060 [Mycena sp. CBHHK59/15]